MPSTYLRLTIGIQPFHLESTFISAYNLSEDEYKHTTLFFNILLYYQFLKVIFLHLIFINIQNTPKLSQIIKIAK